MRGRSENLKFNDDNFKIYVMNNIKYLFNIVVLINILINCAFGEVYSYVMIIESDVKGDFVEPYEFQIISGMDKVLENDEGFVTNAKYLYNALIGKGYIPASGRDLSTIIKLSYWTNSETFCYHSESSSSKNSSSATSTNEISETIHKKFLKVEAYSNATNKLMWETTIICTINNDKQLPTAIPYMIIGLIEHFGKQGTFDMAIKSDDPRIYPIINGINIY